VFQSRGDETELDRAFVDKIADPLVHMIRNAVDHGIETPPERAKTGKNPEALIELRAYHEGGNIHVEVRDDGRGLNQEAILAKAIEKGLVGLDERLNEQEIFNLIFLPGFSTAKQVTEVSGRGVGMDVVKRNIEELRGYVQIQSQLGQGTRFKIILPLTLALIDGMVVKVGPERFIIPVLSVVESLRPPAGMINTIIGRGEMVTIRNRQLPLFRLSKLFGLNGAQQDATKALVVIVEHEGRHSGLLVDDLVGMQQTVIKNLGAGMPQNLGFSGGAIMADGRIGLIVDVAGVLKLARNEVAVRRV
jgi:two-component system chemotaxis sensor kinase CheA